MYLFLRNLFTLAFVCAIFYFSSTGCKKTVVEKITNDTTIIKDTTVIVDSTLNKTEILTLWQNSSYDVLDTATGYETLFQFNKSDFVGVDSIVFSSNPAVNYTTDSCYVSLYDITDNVPIAGSTLGSNQLEYSTTNSYPGSHFFQTGNLFSAMPAKTIVLGAMIRGTRIGNSVPNEAWPTCGYLYLYRK